ncbi:MAG: AarF/ABC1/UbiB kinase family protein [Deltaproteobacteria bacterium]|nr:AarF/ABC1/UbiB kinase family protein [Deltaproteobacteria bacterium]
MEGHAPTPSPTKPHGSPIRPPWRFLKAYVVTLRILSSYLWIRLLARYRSKVAIDLVLQKANLRNARRIYRAIVELQGLYIKVGQLFSIMTNFLPDAFRTELAGLQDQVPPRPFRAIEKRLREEFGGRGPKELFESFEETPVASASIGQVHVARLPGGRRVAVKVQYPDIDEIVRSDLAALRRIFSLINRFVPYHGLDAIYHEIRAMVLQELDFTSEARNAELIAKNFAGREDVRFPQVVRDLTTPRVLTTEFVDAVKINDLKGLERLQVDRKALARLVIESYCQQIFHHGLYHADPHPGNILVSAGPTIHFLDFGAVAVLSEQMRGGLVTLLQGAINRDTQKIVTSLRQMGFLAHQADPKVYDRVVEYFHDRFQREIKLESFNLKDIKFDPQQGLENLADLRQMNISLADITDTFRVPKEWIMLERTILLLMGLCTELDPELNPMAVIRPHVEEFVLGKDGDWSRFMLDTSRDIILAALALPAEIKKFTSRAMQGEIEIKLAGQSEYAQLYYLLVQQVVFTALTITAAVAALRFDERGMDRALDSTIWAGSFFGVMLLRSMLKARRWIRRQTRRR